MKIFEFKLFQYTALLYPIEMKSAETIMESIRKLFCRAADAITRWVPFKLPDDVQEFAGKAIGDLSLLVDEMNGSSSEEVRLARQNAAEVQAIMVAADRLVADAIPDAKKRQFAFLDLVALRDQPPKSPEEFFNAVQAQFNIQITPGMLENARAEVDARKGLEEKFPGAAGFNQIFAKHADKEFVDGVQALQLGLRGILVVSGNKKFPTPRLNPKDSELVALSSKALIGLSSPGTQPDERTAHVYNAMYSVTQAITGLREKGFNRAARKIEKQVRRHFNKIKDKGLRKLLSNAFYYSQKIDIPSRTPPEPPAGTAPAPAPA